MASFDDHIDSLFAHQEAGQQNKGRRRRNTQAWNIKVIENGLVTPMRQTFSSAGTLPRRRKIILEFDYNLLPVGEAGGLLSGYLGQLGADFVKFPICVDNWGKMSKHKETAYDIIKTFHYEEDPEGEIKKNMLKRLGKCWKDTRGNLFSTFYDDRKSVGKNVKHHMPSGIDDEHWKFFLLYRLKDETQVTAYLAWPFVSIKLIYLSLVVGKI